MAARSCLILPDDPRLEAEAWLACDASALLLDLRAPRAGALAFCGKPANLARAPRFTRGSGRSSVPTSTSALESMLRSPPDGIFLDGAEGGASVQHLAAKLAVFEAAGRAGGRRHDHYRRRRRDSGRDFHARKL